MNWTDNHSTPELLLQGPAKFRELEGCLRSRKRRDRASDLATDLFLIIEALAKRLGAMEWNERVGSADDNEDEEEENEPHVEVSLSEALALSAQLSDEDELNVEDLDATELKQRVKELEAQRLDFFRSIIRYTTNGCRSAEEVTKKWLALVRRVDPHSLRAIGMSQTAVARALGERRATTSAREQREFEEPMRRSGARGFHGVGGLRSQENRDNCARAQKGNRNRATGHARQFSEEASGDPETAKTNKKSNS